MVLLYPQLGVLSSKKAKIAIYTKTKEIIVQLVKISNKHSKCVPEVIEKCAMVQRTDVCLSSFLMGAAWATAPRKNKRESARNKGGDGVGGVNKVQKCKLTGSQQAAVVADYAECRSYAAVGRKFGVADTTVKRIVEANGELWTDAEQKAEANRQDIIAYMDGQSGRICEFIDRFLMRLNSDEIDKLELDKAAKVFGIVFDKFCRPAQQVDINAAGIVVSLEGDLSDWGR